MAELGVKKEKLEIETLRGRNDKQFALVRNFPGLDAEMNEENLRDMANQLIEAADYLKSINK